MSTLTGQVITLSAQDTAGRVKEITEKLEQGVKDLFSSERFQAYLNVMSKFWRSSLNNTLLIAFQKPEASLVAGFSKWKKDFQRVVKKGEKGIKIFAPAPYKIKQEVEKTDPQTGVPVLDSNGKPVIETKEITIPSFKVVSVFDVSQTEGKELPDIGVDELTGSVEDFERFFDALKKVSPVSISFEDIQNGAHGFYSPLENRIVINKGMSELQTLKTTIHEIAHAKLHSIDKSKPEPRWKVVMVSGGGVKQDLSCGFETEAEAMAFAEREGWCFIDENQFEWQLEVEEDISHIQEVKKNRHTKEVEAESVAYTVCQHYGLDTSDYSFGYIAGWSSGKETKELKDSLEVIRSTASNLITEIDKCIEESEIPLF